MMGVKDTQKELFSYLIAAVQNVRILLSHADPMSTAVTQELKAVIRTHLSALGRTYLVIFRVVGRFRQFMGSLSSTMAEQPRGLARVVPVFN